MSRSLGSRLPPELVERFSQKDLASRLGHVIPVVSVDARGRPHPMLCSYLEILAVDPGTIRMVIGARSRSAANIEARGFVTLLVIEPELTMYVKCRAVGPAVAAGELARFELSVEDVLEDAAAAWEEWLEITAGITYRPVPALDQPWVKATLALLHGGLTRGE